MSARLYTVYILRCADDSLYTGITVDLARRLAAHQAGAASRYTRARLPVTLAWSRGRQDPRVARQVEYAIKQLPRREKLRLIGGSTRLWRQLKRGLERS